MLLLKLINVLVPPCRLPDSVSDEEGAIVEPLAVAVHACRRAGVWAGNTMLVTGAGPIGLLCLVVAKALGATNILVTGKFSSRLQTMQHQIWSINRDSRDFCFTSNHDLSFPDIRESRLELAKKMGADHTMLVTSGDAQSQAQQVRQVMGCMPDITMECSGTQPGLSLAIYVSGLLQPLLHSLARPISP